MLRLQHCCHDEKNFQLLTDVPTWILCQRFEQIYVWVCVSWRGRAYILSYSKNDWPYLTLLRKFQLECEAAVLIILMVLFAIFFSLTSGFVLIN